MNDELTREEIEAEAADPAQIRGVSDWQGAGAKLRQARERLNLSLEDVAAQIKIAPRKLTALEEEQWQLLPERPYLRGLVKNYARVVQLDPEPLLRSIDAAVGASNRPQELSLKPALQAPFPHRPAGPHESPVNKLIALGVLGCVVIIGALVLPGTPEFHHVSAMVTDYLHRQPEPDKVALGASAPPVADSGSADSAAASTSAAPNSGSPTPGAAAGTGTSRGTSTGQSAPASPTSNATGDVVALNSTKTPSTSTPAAGAVNAQAALTASPSLSTSTTLGSSASGNASSSGAVTMQFRDDSWVEVRQADGKLLSSQIYHGGTEQAIDASTPVQIVIGNAPAVSLKYRGQPVDLDSYTRARVARLNLP